MSLFRPVPGGCAPASIGLKKNLSAVCSLSIVWGSRIAVACSAVCFIAAIRVYYAPTSPCSGCSLSWCSHLPPSRHCFTWAHATSPNYDGWPQAPVIRRADLLHRLRQTRQFLLRCHASSFHIQFVYAFIPSINAATRSAFSLDSSRFSDLIISSRISIDLYSWISFFNSSNEENSLFII